MAKEPRAINLIIPGDTQHNYGIFAAIGVLTVSWGNAESVFLTILRHLIAQGNAGSAEVIWLSFRGNVKGRLDLIQRLAAQRVPDAKLRKALKKHSERFIALSGVRNRYAHSIYAYDVHGRLEKAQNAQLDFDEARPIKIKNVPLDVAAINEMNNTSRELIKFSTALWDLSDEIAQTLGVKPEARPEQPTRSGNS